MWRMQTPPVGEEAAGNTERRGEDNRIALLPRLRRYVGYSHGKAFGRLSAPSLAAHGCHFYKSDVGREVCTVL